MCFLGHRRQVIIFTILDGVVSSICGQNTVGLQPCSHEEADTRMPLHVKDPMNCGLKTVTIRTVGTDVVVLAVAHFQGLPNIEQLWIAFGTGKEFKYIPSIRLPLQYVLNLPKESCSFIHSPAAT